MRGMSSNAVCFGASATALAVILATVQPSWGATTSPPPPERITTVGTVVHLTMEGGFHGIVDQTGARWEPTNLPEAFRLPCLRVAFDALVTDHVGTHMWGRTMELLSIKRIDPSDEARSPEEGTSPCVDLQDRQSTAPESADTIRFRGAESSSWGTVKHLWR